MQRSEIASGAVGDGARVPQRSEDLPRHQWWPAHAAAQLPATVPQQHVQPLLMHMGTIPRGQPLVGMPNHLEGHDVQAVAAHSLMPAMHAHLHAVDPTASGLPPGLETRDHMGMSDIEHRASAVFVGGNVATMAATSSAAVPHVPPPSTGAGYLGVLPDRSRLPLELARMDIPHGGAVAGDASILIPRQSLMSSGLPHEPDEQQLLSAAGFPRVVQPPRLGAAGMYAYGEQLEVGSSVPGQLAQQPASSSLEANPGAPHRPSMRGSMDVGDSGGQKTWFVIVVDEVRRKQHGFKLLEVEGAMRMDNTCNAIEWRRKELGGVTFEAQTFVKASTLPAQMALPADQWVPVHTMRGKMRGPSSDIHFLMVEQEATMVQQLYGTGGVGLRGSDDDHEGRLRKREADGDFHDRGGGKSGVGEELEDGREGKRRRKATYERGRAGVGPEESTGGDRGPGGKIVEGEWRCEVCNIIFSSSQALGGHRINSTDHKQNLARLRRQEEVDGGTEEAEPRLSRHVYSNAPTAEESSKSGRRARLPSMAQMPGFHRVLAGFPAEVGTDLCVSQSPTAYFSSCRLELFRRHVEFGRLGSRIIDRYFTECWQEFEKIIMDLKNLPELAETGITQDKMTDEQMQDLRVFMRMLRTKKKSLDINRRAVSKRIKGLQNERESPKDSGRKKDKDARASEAASDQGAATLAPKPLTTA